MSVALDFPGERIARLTLKRPEKRNALNGMMVAALLAGLEKLSREPARKQIRVLLVEGEGRDFCAGADLDWMKKMAQASRHENEADALQLATLFRRLHEMTVPVLLLAQGNICGGGMGLVAAASMVLAAENAVFFFPEISRGLAPAVVSPWVMNTIGKRRAGYYFMTGEKMTAVDAMSFGLVHGIFPAASLQQTGLKLAERICTFDPVAMTEIRSLLSGAFPTDEMTANCLARLRARWVSP